MDMKKKKEIIKKVGVFVSCFVLILFYNNCGPGFQSISESSLNSQQDIGTTTTTMPAPTSTTTTTSTTLKPTTTTTTMAIPGMTTTTTTSTTLKPTTTTTTMPASTTTTTLPSGTSAAAQIAFPPNGATSDTHIIVRGTYISGVTQISVNGTPATLTANKWRVDVNLAVGTNTLRMDATVNGVSHPGLATVTIDRFTTDTAIKRGPGDWPGRPLGMSYDKANQRIIMGDDIIDGAWEMRMSDGGRRTIAKSEGDKIGGGIDLTFPTSVATDANQCFIVDTALIAKVNLNNGDRSQLIDAKNGGFGDIFLNPDSSSLYVSTGESILKMSPVNGTSTVVSSAAVGSGASLHNMADFGISWARNMAYTTVYYDDTILSVDLSTGDRKVFSTAASGEPKLSDPRKLIVDDITGQAFVYDSNRLIAIDLMTGRRKVIGATGPLTSLTSIVTMTMTPYGPVLLDYVLQGEGGTPRTPTLILVDPIEGTRLILSR